MFTVKYEIVGIVVVAVLVATLKAGNTEARSVSQRVVAYNKAKTKHERKRNSTVSSYFRHDPYGPNTYAFGYELEDKETGNIQFRDERRHVNGTIEGSFGYVRPDGRVTLTQYMADRGRGYLSHTASYEPGEEHKWADQWPTKRPSILMDRGHLGGGPFNVTFDQRQHLNVTDIALPAELVDDVRAQHGIEVGGDSEGGGPKTELVPSTLLDIVNGQVPLTMRPGASGVGASVGFETVHNFIPEGFPIVPFQLPQKESDTDSDPGSPEQEINEMEEEKVEPEEEKVEADQSMGGNKYERGKKNNDEKAMGTEALRRGEEGEGKGADEVEGKGEEIGDEETSKEIIGKKGSETAEIQSEKNIEEEIVEPKKSEAENQPIIEGNGKVKKAGEEHGENAPNEKMAMKESEEEDEARENQKETDMKTVESEGRKNIEGTEDDEGIKDDESTLKIMKKPTKDTPRMQTNTPKPLVTAEGRGNDDWYTQVISDARKEFLQNLPNLQ